MVMRRKPARKRTQARSSYRIYSIAPFGDARSDEITRGSSDRTRNSNGVCISVYLDDFIGSHNDEEVLKAAYKDIHDTCVSAGLVPNPAKLTPPNAAITAFNCYLTHGSACLTEDRIEKYQTRTDRTATTDAAFEQYRLLVASANA